MGTLLDKPETTKETKGEEGNGIEYAVCSMQGGYLRFFASVLVRCYRAVRAVQFEIQFVQTFSVQLICANLGQFLSSPLPGWRNTMEDSHCCKIGLNEQLKDWSFFAVFDGHAGEAVSKYCAENLLDAILQSEDFKKSIAMGGEFGEEQIALAKSGIKSGFLKLDKEMKELPELVEKKDKSGSTAVCCLVSPKHFYFINCGDSRAVLSRANEVMFSTSDHKPFNVAEKERIQNAGGTVMLQRVNGSLAVSRALGDYEYKQNEDKTDCEQLVSPEPEINVIERDNATDEFIIVACDGIFDVINNEDLCTYIRYLYECKMECSVPSSITSSILDTCLHKVSCHRSSVFCLVFNRPLIAFLSLSANAGKFR